MPAPTSSAVLPQYDIADGVHRAVAAREKGVQLLGARLVIQGKTEQLIYVRPDQLHSPKPVSRRTVTSRRNDPALEAAMATLAGKAGASMKIFILGNAQRSGVSEEAQRLLPFLRAQCGVCIFDLSGEKDLSGETADLALVLGGDGAILRAAHQMGYHQTPVLGINLGKLGFLADLSPDQLRQAWPLVLQGQFRVTRHLMFECVVETPGKSETHLGLNDVTIHAGPPFHMIDLDLLVDGEFVSTISGDGLILATPVGSTAHSLSAGGPVIGQELDAFAITPISPHTLTMRPVVDSADKVYTMVPRRLAEGSALVIDGQDALPLTPEHRITVRRAPVTFGLVKVPGHNYYRTLRDKLHWGTSPNYRTEPPGSEPRTRNKESP